MAVRRMTLKRSLVLAVTIMLLGTGAVIATHEAVGLTSTPVARGAWQGTERGDFLLALIRARGGGQDVFVVNASLTPGGSTMWHGHTGPSVVIVTSGTLRVVEPTRNGGCEITNYTAGQAFNHRATAHNFTNPAAAGGATTNFTVVYFVPPGAPVNHDPNPGGCP